MWDHKEVRYRFERRDFYIASVILATLTFIIYSIYLIANRSNYIDPVLNAKPAEIKAIVLSPENAIKTDYNLVNRSITIDNNNSKFKILDALNRAKPNSANHPNPKWLCLLTIVKQSEKYSCKIYSSTNKGVLIFFYSHGSWGFNLGEYRSDSNENIGRLFGLSYSGVSHSVQSAKLKLGQSRQLQAKFDQLNSLFKV